MSIKFTPASKLFAEWSKNPEYVAAYTALEEEFALAEALIEARVQSGLTQEQIAAKMGTTHAAIIRLEGGCSMPSMRTLRRFADATGSKLRISFQPLTKPIR